MDCGRLHTLGRTYGDDDCVDCVVADIMMERDEARAEVERLRDAISEMPDCQLRFLNKDDYDAWLAWKIKYFDHNGKLKQLEAGDE